MCHWALDSTIRGIAAFGYHNFAVLEVWKPDHASDVCLQVCVLPSLCSPFLGDEWRLIIGVLFGRLLMPLPIS